MKYGAEGKLGAIRKFMRYASIYGVGRTAFKVAGRLRVRPTFRRNVTSPGDIAIIGCGQFAFATIGFFLSASTDRRIVACFDIDPNAARSLAKSLDVPNVCASAEELLQLPDVRLVYIASNHASHASYAIRALAQGLDVYVEKPVAVSFDDLAKISAGRTSSRGRLFSGFNRPFSAAVRSLRKRIKIAPQGGFSIQCFVSGHMLAPNHWYRAAGEGMRICGNAGHWIDLMVHVLSWRSVPTRWFLSTSAANPDEPDDNFVATITTDRDDIFSLMVTSRSEPFEGINESIHIQHEATTCKIDDFRQMTLWQGEAVRHEHYWPKDVGHEGAILQPFSTDMERCWGEIELSTALTLSLLAMVESRTAAMSVSTSELLARIRPRAASLDAYQ